MTTNLIVVTGGAGFIGSNLVEEMACRRQLVVVIDDFDNPAKWDNIRHPNIHDLVNWSEAFDWLDQHAQEISAVYHLGAISATTANNINLLLAKNVHFTNSIWEWCVRYEKPLIYASSAATYGSGELGFSDTMSLQELEALAPLNPYAWSKHIVDLRNARAAAVGAPQPPAWYGVKFFNVYGPRETHKGEMRSVALKLYETVKTGSHVELFRSHRPDFGDGKQLRDFVYVKDCVEVLLWLMQQRPESGIYNIGTGNAESFLEIANAVIAETRPQTDLRFIDMPEAIRERYQYFTQADIAKLRAAGYLTPFRTVAEGVREYVRALIAAER